MDRHADRPPAEGRTYADLVREYFPHYTGEEVDYMLWELTPFPLGGPDLVRASLERNLQHRTWFHINEDRAQCICGSAFTIPPGADRRLVRDLHAEHIRGH